MQEEQAESGHNSANRWLSYSPEIKVFDCTVRDGGLMNDHNFEDTLVKAVYEACVAAGIDYMEFGYKGSKKIFSPDRYGAWKYCTEDDLKRIVADNPSNLKLSVMADAERTDYHTDILPAQDSVFDIIRVATYIHQIPVALDMLKDAHDKGYETSLNLMAASVIQECELDEALEILAKSEVDIIYVVDSFGSMYSERIKYLIEKFKSYTDPVGKQVGIHAHNNQQLAFANTIEALINGATMLDASIAGLGRGAGNCAMESLLGFLHNPKFHLRPLLKCIQEQVEPMQKSLGWGFAIPYMLTGILNQHPRTAIAFNASEDSGNYVKFFDSIIEEE